MHKFFIFLFLAVINFFIIFNLTLAATPLEYIPLVSLDLNGGGAGKTTASAYIKTFLTAFMAVVVAMALFKVTQGGIKLMFGGDSSSMKTEGKNDITEAIKGLILALLTYLILSLINPKLLPGADLFSFKLTP